MTDNDLEFDEPSLGEIIQLSYEIREQTAEPEDAKRLLQHFCNLVDRNKTIPDPLHEHLRDSFRDYLSGEQKLESALGLKRKKARPKADPEIRTIMATDLLRFRLMERVSHEDARERVSKEFGFGITVVSDAWAEYKQDALKLLKIERIEGGCPWTADEEKRLIKIFSKEPWFLSPEKSTTRPD